MPQTFSLADVLETSHDNRARGIYTALPGIVVAYDAETQLASVQPAIAQRVFGELSTFHELPPVIPGVPVVFPGSGDNYMTFPIEPGASVLLVFASSSVDEWLSEGGVVTPLMDHRNHLTDAFAIPGLRPQKKKIKPAPPSSSMVLATGGTTKLRLGSPTASESAVLGETFKSDLNSLLDLVSAFAGTVKTTSLLDAGTAMGALIGGITSFKGTWAARLSTKVKVE